jgi:hypothetical protein
MNYNLIIQPEAEFDIQNAFEWYESQGPGLGSEFVRAVDTCLSLSSFFGNGRRIYLN